MSNSPQSRFWKALGLSESFKLSKARDSNPRISPLWLLLPGGAIAVFSFLAIRIESACACGGVEAEGKMLVGALQRAQQAYFVDRNALTSSLEDLNVRFRADMENYRIAIRTTETAAFHYAIPKFDRAPASRLVSFGDIPLGKVPSKPLRGAVSAVFVLPGDSPSVRTQTILCIADEPGSFPIDRPILRDGVPTCTSGTRSY